MKRVTGQAITPPLRAGYTTLGRVVSSLYTRYTTLGRVGLFPGCGTTTLGRVGFFPRSGYTTLGRVVLFPRRVTFRHSCLLSRVKAGPVIHPFHCWRRKWPSERHPEEIPVKEGKSGPKETPRNTLVNRPRKDTRFTVCPDPRARQ